MLAVLALGCLPALLPAAKSAPPAATRRQQNAPAFTQKQKDQLPIQARWRRQRWQAQWITWPSGGDSSLAFGVFHFRRRVEFATAPARCVIHVSADNRFLLRVNGHYAGGGPGYGNLGHWRYETLDIARWLHPGANWIAATVWDWGANAPMRQISNRLGFLLQADDPRLAHSGLNTGRGWQVERERGWRRIPHDATSAALHSYFVAGPGLELQAARYDWHWAEGQPSGRSAQPPAQGPQGNETSAPPSGGWRAARVLSSGSPRGSQDAPNAWMLTPDPLPAMPRTPTSPGRMARARGLPLAAASVFPRAALTIPPHRRVTLLLRRHALVTAYPTLITSGGAGSRVRLTYAEALYKPDGTKGNRDHIAGKHIFGAYDRFLPDGGARRRFTPLDWRTWRYLQLDITTGAQPLRLDTLRAAYTAYPFRLRARFRCNAGWLQPVWLTSWRTARLCAHTTFMDCPYWERLQYAGDTRIQALLSYVLTGDDRLGRQAIAALDASRMPDGLTASRYPSRLTQVIPPFSLMWVGMLRDFWRYRGDAAFTRRHLPGTRTVLDWFLRHRLPDGMLARLPWWNFVDWTSGYRDGAPPETKRGDSAALTLQFAEALGDGAALESALGRRGRAARYLRARAAALAAVRRLCWNPRRRLLADTPQQKSYSQETNILGVWQGAVPKGERAGVLRRLFAAELTGKADAALPPISAASYYFRFYLARALNRAGLGDDYLKLLGPWRAMLAEGLTTWAEMPEPTRSDCHAWSAHPDYDLLTTVAGLRPAAPGFARVKITPHLGPLTHLRAAMPTPHGLIRVEYQRRGNQLAAQITLPAGVSGELSWHAQQRALPGGKTIRLQISGGRPSGTAAFTVRR